MHYAEALFKLGRLKTLPAFAMPFPGKKESLLLGRIKRLLHNQQNKFSYSFQSVLLGLFSLLITTGVFISSSDKPVRQKIETKVNTKITNEKNQIINRLTVIGNPSDVKTIAVTQVMKKEIKHEDAETVTVKTKESAPEIIETAVNNSLNETLKLKQNYLLQVQQSLDSIKQVFPQYQQAVDAQVLVTPEVMQKAMSYRNFKQIENMLAASGNSINITEDETSKDSYRRLMTIEATDKDGNKHVYTVIVELYQ